MYYQVRTKYFFCLKTISNRKLFFSHNVHQILPFYIFFFNGLNIVQEYINPLELMDVDILEDDNERPHSYVTIPSVHRIEHIIKDNVGYMYFKSKTTERKM